MRSVAKHSYLKGKLGKSKAKAHVDYIQHRSGRDKDGEKRLFFDKEREGIDGREVKQDIDNMAYNPVVVHKLMLSPGCDGVDMKQYVREVMTELGNEKGLDLDWKAVVHKNTMHDHAHVIVLGLDKNGHRVRLAKDDYTKIREFGDKYLERNHYYERFLDKDIQTLLKEPDYRPRGDTEFNRLVGELYAVKGEKEPEKEKGKEQEKDGPDRDDGKKEKEKEKDPFRDQEEWRRLDADFAKYLRDMNRTTELYGKNYKQIIREQQGRMAEEHGHYVSAMEIQRLEEMAARFPDKREMFTELIADIKRFDAQQWQEGRKFDDVDKLLGADRSIEKVQDRKQDITPGKLSADEQSFINEQVRTELDKPIEQEKEPERDDDAFGRGER
jgi:hypothetical protein